MNKELLFEAIRIASYQTFLLFQTLTKTSRPIFLPTTVLQFLTDHTRSAAEETVYSPDRPPGGFHAELPLEYHGNHKLPSNPEKLFNCRLNYFDCELAIRELQVERFITFAFLTILESN